MQQPARKKHADCVNFQEPRPQLTDATRSERLARIATANTRTLPTVPPTQQPAQVAIATTTADLISRRLNSTAQQDDCDLHRPGERTFLGVTRP